jgi:hypothetical protein
MRTQIVMDATGDTRHHFDANNRLRWPRRSSGSWN